MYEIVFSDESLQDLFDIENFISQDSSIIAKKVVDSIVKSTHTLAIFPNIGIEKSGTDREIIDPIYKYQVRYRVKNKEIYIVTIYKYQNK